MDPQIYGNNLQQRRLKIRLLENVYQAWGGITILWGMTDDSVGQLVILMDKNKTGP